MAQHVDIAVCAHVSCWAILRYYSQTFPQHREYLVHDITQLVAPFDPGGLVPSLGFNVQVAERVFQAAGYFPLLVVKRKASPDEAFYSQLLAYLESGFPLFVAMPSEKHAIVIVGYNWQEPAALPGSASSHVWSQVESLLAVDDNLLPYSTVPLHSNRVAGGISALHSRRVRRLHRGAAGQDLLSRGGDRRLEQTELERSLTRACAAPQQEPLQLRRYFITTVSGLREHAREYHSQLGDTLVGLMMHLETAQFVWVVEYCSVAQWQAGHVWREGQS